MIFVAGVSIGRIRHSARPEAAFITGATLNVDGGLLA